MSGGHSGSGVVRHLDGTGVDGSLSRSVCLLAVLLTLAVAGCSSISATLGVSPSAAAPTIAPTSRVTQATEPGFATTGSMVSPSRGYHTATLLDNGRVLIVGGQTVTEGSASFFSSAELYDPAAGTFSPTGSMADARESDSATLLQDGRVLIVGGQNDQILASAELYDPKTGKFSPTGSLDAPRENHTATRMADGRVLIAGGDPAGGDSQTPLASAEIYDPKSGTFSPTGSMTTARLRAGAALLGDGRVLIVGGLDAQVNTLSTAEIYDPKSGTFSPTGSILIAESVMAVMTLPDGRVFIAGATAYGSSIAELYDPTTGSFSATGRMAVHSMDTDVLLHDGRVLVLGGYLAGAGGNGSADLYDPNTNSFGPAGTMTSPRLGQSATVMADGRVVVAGGANDASAEVYTPPAPGATVTPSPAPTLAVPAELTGLPVTSLAASQIHRSGAYASTAFGALVYSIASKGQAAAEVTVSNLSTGAAKTAGVRLPANEIVPQDPTHPTQVYSATDGRYLVVYAHHPSAPPTGPIAIPGCGSSGGDWQLLVAPLDPATGLPSGSFTVFASGVMKRVFNAPRAGECGNAWYQNTVFAVDAGMIAYTVDDVTSARPMGSRILLRSLAGGATVRSVVATEMVYEVHLSGTTIAWAECQNILLTNEPEQVKFRVSTATNPAPLDVTSGPVSGGRDLPAVRLVGDEISWDGLGNTSVWYQRIGAGSPQSLTPIDLACQLAASTPSHVAAYCTWNGTGGIPNRSSLLVATIGGGLRQVQGLPADATLRPIISNGWFVDSGGEVAYQPVTNTYALLVAALGM
jgi:hypothetical protein